MSRVKTQGVTSLSGKRLQKAQAEMGRKGLHASWQGRMQAVLEHMIKTLGPPISNPQEQAEFFYQTPLKMLARCAAVENRDKAEVAQEYQTELDLAYRTVADEYAVIEERRASDICACAAVMGELAKEDNIPTLPEPWNTIWRMVCSTETEDPKDHLTAAQQGIWEQSVGQAKSYSEAGLRGAFRQMVAEYNEPRPKPVAGPVLVAMWLDPKLSFMEQPCCDAKMPYHAAGCDGTVHAEEEETEAAEAPAAESDSQPNSPKLVSLE
ncbi:MAG: hypothetical protein ACYC6M_15855 [Terriglobales bacterium]